MKLVALCILAIAKASAISEMPPDAELVAGPPRSSLPLCSNIKRRKGGRQVTYRATTCKLEAAGACDSLCGPGGMIEPPCYARCNGNGRGGVGTCTISKKNQATQKREPVFSCRGPSAEEDDFGEVITSFTEGPEAAAGRVFNALRGIDN